MKKGHGFGNCLRIWKMFIDFKKNQEFLKIARHVVWKTFIENSKIVQELEDKIGKKTWKHGKRQETKLKSKTKNPNSLWKTKTIVCLVIAHLSGSIKYKKKNEKKKKYPHESACKSII